jgi:uncharacterized protein with ParB-like and HNH nuclease domain/predicted transport protein
MKAVEAKLLQFLSNSNQFVIPIYQRAYSWTEPECEQLWNDIMRAGDRDSVVAHFMGSIVYIERDLYQVTSQSPLLVIDGQQRLTTVTLILEALARNLGDSEPVEGFSAKKIRSYYLRNIVEEGERSFKLILSQTDKTSLLSILQQKSLPEDSSIRIDQNFEYFDNKIKSLGQEIDKFCRGISKLMIVDIALTRGQDNPQLIFESMNSTGKELSQADLIRNYILMGLEQEIQTTLYEDHWRPMEKRFGQASYSSDFDSFVRFYLTMKLGEIPNISDVYEEFKKYSQEPETAEKGVQWLVADIQQNAYNYCSMALNKETDADLADAFADLRELNAGIAYPFLLEVYADYKTDLIKKEELLQIVRLVESYVFRRAVCSIPTNSMNKTFAGMNKHIVKGKYLESVQAHLLNLSSYRRFPDDDEFRRDFEYRDLYQFRRNKYYLRRLENHEHKEKIQLDDYTIEHIMPQNENLSKEWRDELGPDWEEIQKRYLHTLGNLTLTRYNSEYSDKPFQTKRDMDGGFKASPVRLNSDLKEIPNWTQNQIVKRAQRLSKVGTEVWYRPALSSDVLKSYQVAAKNRETYQIEDFKHLTVDSQMRNLFDSLEREVLAIDECVTEVPLKLYVAFKAETNFVDVIPKAKSLGLTLNLNIDELVDPRKMATDITGMGKWGNGNVRVDLKSEEDLHYVIGLIRQSFDLQMNGLDQ